MVTYIDLARDEYKAANVLMKVGQYNIAARIAYLCCEKMMKGHLEENNKLDRNLSSTYNLRNLYKATNIQDKDLGIEIRGLATYYYNTAYPGPDFMNVGKSDVIYILEVCGTLGKILGYNLEGETTQTNHLGGGSSKGNNTLEGLPKSDIEAIGLMVEEIKKQTGDFLIDVLLFGSYAKGTYQPDSDYDLCAVLKEGMERKDIRYLQNSRYHLEDEYGIRKECDIILCTKETLENEVMVYEYVKRDGVSVLNL